MASLSDAVEIAESYVAPLIDPDHAGSENGLLTLLNSQNVQNDDISSEDVSKIFLQKSMDTLQAIHSAAIADGFSYETEYDGNLMRTVYALIDLIATQWLLPCLSPGAVFPHRPKTTLSAAPTNVQHDKVQCLEIVSEVINLLDTNENAGVSSIVSQRFLPDLVSAIAELAFAPETGNFTDQEVWQKRFTALIDKTPTSRLLPLLTSYVSHDLPSWLRPHITRPLSLLPLRPRGIRHVVEYIAMSHQSDDKDRKANASNGVPVTLSAIQQATKLIASPPASTSLEKWVEMIAPQLWTMLDGVEGPDMARAAGHIISSGFLSKRSTGSPGKPGWNTFAVPLMKTLSPKGTVTTAAPTDGRIDIIMPSSDMLRALQRLATIISSHPNTGVTPRLVRPIKLALWGMLNYAKAPREKVFVREKWSTIPETILKRYLELEGEVQQIDELAQKLLWDGQLQWTYSPGTDGGIDIRRRSLASDDMSAVLARLESVEARTKVFVKLLPTSDTNSDTIISVFFELTRRWLTPESPTSSEKSLAGDSDTDAFGMLINAKLSQALLERLQAKLTKDPTRLMAFFNQIFQQFVSRDKQRQECISSLSQPTFESIHTIVVRDGLSTRSPETSTDSESEDLAITSISILKMFLTSSMEQNDDTSEILKGIAVSLRYICSGTGPFSPDLVDPAKSALNLIEKWFGESGGKARRENPMSEASSGWDAIIGELAAPEAPIRASAIASIQKLIGGNVPGKIDVAQTAHLLIQVIRMDPESYVYLPAIKSLVSLCRKQNRPHFVCRIALDAFLDTEEEKNGGLEGRLRIGEAIDSLVRDALDSHGSTTPGLLTKYSISEAIALTAEVCLKLADRRGRRPKTHAAREAATLTQIAKERRKNEDALRAWGGEAPEIDMKLIDPSFEPETVQQAQEREYLEGMVKGWEDTGLEEDIRIRTSALSITCTLFEQHLRVRPLGDKMIQAIDMALSISALEYQPERIILRRAAVMVVMSILRGIDALLESRDLVDADRLLQLGSSKWYDAQRIMRWLSTEDHDEIVRGHAYAVADGLETVRIKREVANEVPSNEIHYMADSNRSGSVGLKGVKVDTDQLKSGRALVEELE